MKSTSETLPHKESVNFRVIVVIQTQSEVNCGTMLMRVTRDFFRSGLFCLSPRRPRLRRWPLSTISDHGPISPVPGDSATQAYLPEKRGDHG